MCEGLKKSSYMSVCNAVPVLKQLVQLGCISHWDFYTESPAKK